MNYVKTAEIHGFWGSKHVFIKFNDDLNFLIGSNGSGKTTIINLIAAVLRADVRTLFSIQFNKITIKLKSSKDNVKPVIEVTKSVNGDGGNLLLHYNVREKTTEKGERYIIESPFDERLYREMHYSRSKRWNRSGAHLSTIMGKLVEVNWLSIHRTTLQRERRYDREETFESTVDRKLNEISKAFSSYFSLLNSEADKEGKNFQELAFLSLLEQNIDFNDVLDELSDASVDEAPVVGVLRDLGVTRNNARKSVSAYLKKLNELRKRSSQGESFTLEDAIALSNARRIREMTQHWHDLQKKREEIFGPRIQFETIISELFNDKELHFDARNNPKVHLDSGDEVEIDVLSSGEKQLFILIGEALLQEGRPVVFISDEPELSLHVSWQSVLFRNIRSLNESCQIISATHSPDIVGAFKDRVIKIEKCISNV